MDDVVSKFVKEKLQEEKSQILRKLTSGDLTQEEKSQIESRLKEISQKLVILK